LPVLICMNTARLFLFLLKRDFKTRYAGSALGCFWLVLQPVLTFAIYAVVFGLFFKFRVKFLDQDMGFLPYFFTGFWAWISLQEGLSRSAGVLIEYASIIKKVRLPVEALVPTAIVSSLVNLVIGLVLFLCYMFWRHGWESVHVSGMYLIVFPLAVQLTLSCGLGFFFAIVCVYLRDFSAWLPALLNFWFFTTPVLYSVSQIPQHYQWLFRLNPMVPVLDAYRSVLLTGVLGPTVKGLGQSMVLSVLILAAGFYCFQRGKGWVADVL